MKSTSHVVLAALLLCAVLLSAQTTPARSEQKQEPAASSSERNQQSQTRSTLASGNVEILSDTMGVNFGPYLERVYRDVRLIFC